MNDDYLWDRSGPPDPEVERLERVLGCLRSAAPPPALPEGTPGTVGTRRISFVYWAVAATLVLACGAAMVWLHRRDGPSWSVVRVAGAPVVGGARVGNVGRLGVGDWLETDRHSRAAVAIGDIGSLEVEPGTRLQLVDARTGRHRLAMARGVVHALIWAPPGQFVVETPSSLAVDLGCAYTLRVDAGGSGLVEVTLGWVGFEFGDRESFVPAGAVCATRPGIGPGTPHYADAPVPLRDALAIVDSDAAPDRRRAALSRALAAARPRDTVTLWHLLARVPPEDRDAVFDALARSAPPPAGVTRDGIRQGDRAMRDAWWDALGLGTTSWWRTWKQRLP